MKFLYQYVAFVDKAQEWFGRAVAWLTAILVAVVCYDVFTRYLLDISSVALQELEWHIFSLIFLLGAAYTLKHDEHVRIDLFYMRYSGKTKAWINLLGSAVFLIPFCVIVILVSFNFVGTSITMNESSPDGGGLPARYLLKAIIPVSFFILLLEGISQLFKSVIQLKELRGGEEGGAA